MRTLLILLLTATLLATSGLAEETPVAPEAIVPLFTADELTQMNYAAVTDAYNAAYGSWWDCWSHSIWLDYVTALRQANYHTSRTGRAIAVTDYIIPPENALPAEQAAAIAVAAVDANTHAATFFPCFMWEERVIYKVVVFTISEGSTIASGNHCVELDALTGEVLGIYEATGSNRGEVYVPHSLWMETSPLPPNG